MTCVAWESGSSLGWRLTLVPQFDPSRHPRNHPSASIRWRMAATCAGQLLFILTICEAGRWTFSWITQSSCHAWLPANVAYCFATFPPSHRPSHVDPARAAGHRWRWLRWWWLRLDSTPPGRHFHSASTSTWSSAVRWLLSLLRFIPFHYEARVP